MNTYERLADRRDKMAVVGLGYVGMPLAYEFAKIFTTIGFDVNRNKVEQYKKGNDVTGEIGNERICDSSLIFTSDQEQLSETMFFIIAVPTPIDSSKRPDLSPVISASEIVGKYLSKGAIVVYESTVYPGVTEELCVPILERESGLTYGEDFKVGYSPERINPGDKVHRVTMIRKIVSGCDNETLEEIAKIYGAIVKAGVYKAESIKVAEAAKVIENAQRDINIAFMNELSVIFHRLGIDTRAVLDAASTKWNFLRFSPGLVGGHCIGVDPYYLSYKSELIGYHPQIILSGRRINDDMGRYVAENTVKHIIQTGKPVLGSRVMVMGITFKENVADIRNSRVVDIVNELKEYGANVMVADPVASKEETLHEYGISLVSPEQARNLDAIVVAVPHNEFADINLESLKEKYTDDQCILIDVKGVYDKCRAVECGFTYWSL